MNRYMTELSRRAAKLLATRPGCIVTVRGVEFTSDPQRRGAACRVLDCPSCGGEGTIDYLDGARFDKWGTPEPRWRKVRCGECDNGVVYGSEEFHAALRERGYHIDEDSGPDPYDDWRDRRDDN